MIIGIAFMSVAVDAVAQQQPQPTLWDHRGEYPIRPEFLEIERPTQQQLQYRVECEYAVSCNSDEYLVGGIVHPLGRGEVEVVMERNVRNIFPHGTIVTALSERYVAAGGTMRSPENPQMRQGFLLYDRKTKQEVWHVVKPVPAEWGKLIKLGISANEKYVAAVFENVRVVCDIANPPDDSGNNYVMQSRRTFVNEYVSRPLVVMSKSGARLVTATQSRQHKLRRLHVWNLNKSQLTHEIRGVDYFVNRHDEIGFLHQMHWGQIRNRQSVAVAFSNDENRLAMHTSDGIDILDLGDPNNCTTISASLKVTDMRFSRNDQYLAAITANDNAIYVFGLRNRPTLVSRLVLSGAHSGSRFLGDDFRRVIAQRSNLSQYLPLLFRLDEKPSIVDPKMTREWVSVDGSAINGSLIGVNKENRWSGFGAAFGQGSSATVEISDERGDPYRPRLWDLVQQHQIDAVYLDDIRRMGQNFEKLSGGH